MANKPGLETGNWFNDWTRKSWIFLDRPARGQAKRHAPAPERLGTCLIRHKPRWTENPQGDQFQTEKLCHPHLTVCIFWGPDTSSKPRNSAAFTREHQPELLRLELFCSALISVLLEEHLISHQVIQSDGNALLIPFFPEKWRFRSAPESAPRFSSHNCFTARWHLVPRPQAPHGAVGVQDVFLMVNTMALGISTSAPYLHYCPLRVSVLPLPFPPAEPTETIMADSETYRYDTQFLGHRWVHKSKHWTETELGNHWDQMTQRKRCSS